MKILISDPVEKVCTEVLEAEGFEVVNKTNMKPDELMKTIAAFDGLIVRSSTKVTQEIIGAGVGLKVIGRAGAGVDNIDVDAATRRGILVMNTPGGNTISTAEHTMSLLLSLARNIPQANASLRAGAWDRKTFVGTELHGKTVGIVGLGKVGREVALRCQAFGMRTIGFDPVLSADVAIKMNIDLVSLDELFASADIITVHTPLNDDTRDLLDDRSLARCRKGVRIVNCARGGIVNEAAMLRSLESGHVAGYAADVFSKEPPGDDPLVKHPHVVATPHLGASTDEAQEKVARQIAEQIIDMLKQRGVAGAVNGEEVRFTFKKELVPFIKLAEKLGRLHAQLLEGKLEKLSISLRGSYAVGAREAVRTAVLKGVLSHLLAEPVNFINAPVLANDMGIRIEEMTEPDHHTYLHLITVRSESDRAKHSFSGTVFGGTIMRLVECDGYDVEVNPVGNLLLYKNVDRPGMLARVGQALADAGINIAGLSLGRVGPGQTAMTIVSVDTPISDALLHKLEELDGFFDLRRVTL